MFSSTMSHVIYVAPQPSQVILPCQDLCPAVAPPLIFDCYKYVPCKCCDDWVHKKDSNGRYSIASRHPISVQIKSCLLFLCKIR